MTRIGFIGLGNMGGPMAANLARAGHTVQVFDLVAQNIERAIAAGCIAAGDAREAVTGCEVVISMLPAGSMCATFGCLRGRICWQPCRLVHW